MVEPTFNHFGTRYALFHGTVHPMVFNGALGAYDIAMHSHTLRVLCNMLLSTMHLG